MPNTYSSTETQLCPNTKAWPLYTALFFSYILTGYFVSLISFQSQIVPIWLPAGIALAGCYLWWWRFVPAVFIASFVFNFSMHPSFENAVVIQNIFIACGASLQAIVGSALLKYWLGNPMNQWRNTKTLYFIFIVGFLVNLISSTIGVNTLSTFNPNYVRENLPLNLIFWWLGDSLGVLLAFPFILGLLHFGQLTTEQRKARAVIIYSVSALFIIIILLTKFFISSANSDKDDLVTHEVRVIENGIYRQVSESNEKLSTLASYVQQNPEASRDEFQSFASELTRSSNTLKAVSWNPIIKQSQRALHEKSLSQIYQQQTAIRGEPLTLNDDIVYVKFISPEENNKKAIGFNVFSNASRKASLAKVQNNYQPQATQIIQLVQSAEKEPAFLLFFPVFSNITATEDITKQLIGFVTGVFLAEKIITNAIRDSQEGIFYHEVWEHDKEQAFISDIPNHVSAAQKTDKHFKHIINVAGQPWTVHLFANESLLLKKKNEAFYRFFLLLVIIVTSITASLLLMNNRQLHLQNIVSQRTRELESAVKKANDANKTKSQFLANMSHEIRTPMNSVIGFAKLARDADDIHEIKSYLENIDISSGFLLQIVNNILDISKIESEKLFLTNEVINLHTVLERIHSLFEVEANKKQLTWHVKDNLPTTTNFSGDQTRIEQILINLCGNAMKFTQQGGVSITANLVEIQEEKAHLEMIITDTGIGIPPEKILTLFQPFTQADASTSRDYGGTGLGLTIAKKLSHLMSGDVTIESEVGSGTQFIFTCILPLSHAEAIEHNSDNKVFQKITNQGEFNTIHDSSQEEEPDSLKKQLGELKVLVAEDNRINQKLIKTILTKLGIDAIIVENGQLAVDYVQQHSVDVILMDCQMPVLDGYQATEQIRALPNHIDLPIIALTADVDTRSKEKALTVGFTKHLGKPINIDQLTESLLAITEMNIKELTQ